MTEMLSVPVTSSLNRKMYDLFVIRNNDDQIDLQRFINYSTGFQI